jgi:prevent-host-death family protein
MPERVGIRELRQNLSVWLRRVAAGESFEVTERGEPVAILAPYVGLHPAIQRLAAQGRLASVARGSFGDLPPLEGPVDHEATASRALQEMREDRI